MFSVITTAPSTDVMAAFDAAPVGNRKVKPAITLAGMDEGKTSIIVTVEDWAATLLVAALRRMNAWFDRVAPQGRIPRGAPIVSHAGASSIRTQRKVDATTRKDRAIRRATKGAA